MARSAVDAGTHRTATARAAEVHNGGQPLAGEKPRRRSNESPVNPLLHASTPRNGSAGEWNPMTTVHGATRRQASPQNPDAKVRSDRHRRTGKVSVFRPESCQARRSFIARATDGCVRAHPLGGSGSASTNSPDHPPCAPSTADMWRAIQAFQAASLQTATLHARRRNVPLTFACVPPDCPCAASVQILARF